MDKIIDLLGQEAEYYLDHTCKTIDKKNIHIPGPDMGGFRQECTYLEQSAGALRTWPAGEYGVCVYFTG